VSLSSLCFLIGIVPIFETTGTRWKFIREFKLGAIEQMEWGASMNSYIAIRNYHQLIGQYLINAASSIGRCNTI
jgi:hypothetical protein